MAAGSGWPPGAGAAILDAMSKDDMMPVEDEPKQMWTLSDDHQMVRLYEQSQRTASRNNSLAMELLTPLSACTHQIPPFSHVIFKTPSILRIADATSMSVAFTRKL